MEKRLKMFFLTEDGIRLFNEISSRQKSRIYKAFVNSDHKEVISFDNVLKKIINGKI